MSTSPSKQNDILLTGASGAIGVAVARRLARAGFNLHLTSRDPSRLQTLSQELSGHGVDIHSYALDLSNQMRCEAVIREFFHTASVPFGLICNAGDLGVLGSFLESDAQAWVSSVEQNFIAHAIMVHAFGREFISNHGKEAAIVVLSGAGLGGAPTPNLSSYGTSKAALTYLVEALSKEFTPLNITINSIAPGQVNSGITEQAIRAGEKRMGAYAVSAQKCKENGGVSPDLAAQLVEFLMSPAARGISGRLLSARFDQKRLRDDVNAVANDPDLYRLRRVDQDLFGATRREKK